MRKLRYGRLRPVLVVSIAVLGLMATAVVPAGAERSGIDGTAKAAAFALNVDVDVLGVPLDVGPLARLRLSGDAGPRFENVVKANVPPLLEALVLATGAETKVGGELASKASARVATVKLKLLGELLLIKVLKSECKVKSDLVEVSSDVVFADGSVLGIAADPLGLHAYPNSRLYIPGVGSLILNEQIIEKRTSSESGLIKVTVNALRLELDGILGYGDVTISQSVCKLRGKDVDPKNIKIVSTTNGQDTSDDVDDDDDDGLLGGLLDDGLLNVDDLLGGDLLGGGLGGLL